MKIHVIAKAGDLRFTAREAEDCIDKAKKYEVRCDILDKDIMALFSTKFKLMLDGTKENIEDFLNYLKMMGFRIKKVS